MTWTEADNKRRLDLLDGDIDGELSRSEKYELDDLTERFLEHRKAVGPLPIAEATATHERA